MIHSSVQFERNGPVCTCREHETRNKGFSPTKAYALAPRQGAPSLLVPRDGIQASFAETLALTLLTGMQITFLKDAALKDKKDKVQPIFMYYRKGQMKKTIEGVNAPEIMKLLDNI